MSTTILSDELHEGDEEIQQYLASIDKLRQECESRGEYIRAQECMNRMREVTLRQAKRLESLTKLVSADVKVEMTEEHQLEILNFNRMWEEKLGAYEERSDDMLRNLKEYHLSEYNNQEAGFELQTANKRPRFSNTVIDLRAFLEKAVQNRKYLEAEEAKNRLIAMEEKEIADFNRNLSLTFDRKRQAIKKKYINELEVMEKKIKRGRDELKKQRDTELTKLLLRHRNAINDLETNTKLRISSTKKSLEKKVTVLTSDPTKTYADFREVSQALRAPAATRRGAQRKMGYTTRMHVVDAQSSDDCDRYLW